MNRNAFLPHKYSSLPVNTFTIYIYMIRLIDLKDSDMMLTKIIIQLLFLIGFVLLNLFETTFYMLLFWILYGLRLFEIPVIWGLVYRFIENLQLFYLVMWVLVVILIYFLKKNKLREEKQGNF